MSDDHAAPAPRPLSPAVADAFRELGLTPGHWAALAPLPLLRYPTLRRPGPADFDCFCALASCLPTAAGDGAEAQEFWTRWLAAAPPPRAYTLLSWHLARNTPDADRERYLTELDRTALRFWPAGVPQPAEPPAVSGLLREAIEVALTFSEFARDVSPGRSPEPKPSASAAAQVPAPAPVIAASAKPTPPPAPEPARPAVIAEIAEGFTTVPLAEALAQAAAVTVAEIREWLADPANARRLLFDDCRGECSEAAIVRDPAAVPKALWVVGDLHADVLTLANVIAHAGRVVEREGEPPAFLFLGDFIDRGRHDHETLLLLFRLVMENPGRVCVVPGNHDVDLRWAEKLGRFVVSIEPAEYCEGLNRLLASDDPADRDRLELARLFVEFCKARPKAVFLPDGTLYTHAGFPHTDLQKVEADPRKGIAERILLREVAQLGEPAAVSDFLWARLAEAPKKRPNRHGGRGHEFGWRDFAQFCRIMTEVVGVPVRRLVRGHDHVPVRWQFPPDYADYPVLTVNAMGRRLDGEPPPAAAPHPFPVMARHIAGALPRVVRLPLDPKEVERAFGAEPPTAGAVPPAEAELPLAAEVPESPPAVPPNEEVDISLDYIGGVPVDDPPAKAPGEKREGGG